MTPRDKNRKMELPGRIRLIGESAMWATIKDTMALPARKILRILLCDTAHTTVMVNILV